MTPEQFTYWLQGFVEVAKRMPTPEEWQQIVDHLQTVFHKVTPDTTLRQVSPGADELRYDWPLWDGGTVIIC